MGCLTSCCYSPSELRAVAGTQQEGKVSAAFDRTGFDVKAFGGHVLIVVLIGGGIAYFTDAKWLAASLWVSAAMFINGSIANVEDGIPGGFDNPDGSDTPDYAKGRGAIKYALKSLGIALALVFAGFVVQTQF